MVEELNVRVFFFLFLVRFIFSRELREKRGGKKITDRMKKYAKKKKRKKEKKLETGEVEDREENRRSSVIHAKKNRNEEVETLIGCEKIGEKKTKKGKLYSPPPPLP
eukprot:TRINITY_DN2836_c0_g4_i1.p1 TRINITY_DN2836_c0_g4~~TRINITY_DN2836_c0_g4_i1.p1  ORF type:complete len:107 (+),score=20.91 TRINITY_DN2836_c0_g4_i1:145-465(+)